MDLSELLNGSEGKAIISSIAGQLGLDEKQAANAVNSAAPAILSGLNKNAQTTEGALSLNKALDKHDGSLLDNLTEIFSGNSQDLLKDGGKIIGHVFGGNQEVVQNAVAKKSGIDTSQVGSLMSMLAPVIMGYLGKEKKATNAKSDDLGRIIGGLLGGGGKNSAGGGIMDIVTGFIDKDKDGNIVDDIMDMFKK